MPNFQRTSSYLQIIPPRIQIQLNQLHPTVNDEEDEEHAFEKLEGLEDGGKT